MKRIRGAISEPSRLVARLEDGNARSARHCPGARAESARTGGSPRPPTTPPTIGASGIAGSLNDAVELTLPVNPPVRAQFDDRSGQTESEAKLPVPLRHDAYLPSSRLTVTITPSVAASLYSNVNYLIEYPYGCVEQTVSSFLPALRLQALFTARHIPPTDKLNKTPEIVRDGLARLSTLEREEGGWGWGRWGNLDIWMTSYALLAREEAGQAGYQVPDSEHARTRVGAGGSQSRE